MVHHPRQGADVISREMREEIEWRAKSCHGAVCLLSRQLLVPEVGFTQVSEGIIKIKARTANQKPRHSPLRSKSGVKAGKRVKRIVLRSRLLISTLLHHPML
jgi:hypothetical protein